MARILEDDAKRLLSEFGLAVPSGRRVTTPIDATDVASAMPGGCVVKALVPTGRRGKAGLVSICSTADEARSAVERMIGMNFDGYLVEAVLIEERIDIAHEYYLSMSIDPAALTFNVLASAFGGVDIEAHAGSITSIGVDPVAPSADREIQLLWSDVGLKDHATVLRDATRNALSAFQSLDATMLELNPLAVDAANRAVAVGAMLAVDDAAIHRHPDLSRLVIEGSDRAARPETLLEQRVAEINADRSQRGSARYLELEGGDIGFLCGGGGASLLLFDAIVAEGGRPANYSEFGGNPTEQRVYDLTRVVLDKPGVRGLFVAHNITNNTQIDVVARGVTRAIRDAGVPAAFPVVAREVGVNDDEGRLIFEEANVLYLGADVSLNGAARIMVERLREAGTW